jgi:hypothetical protein
MTNYDETVLLFAILERIINDLGEELQIEPICVKPSGEECKPDLLLDESKFKTIIEHKASLSENELNIRDIMVEIYEKYYPLLEKDKDQLAALFPERDRNNVGLIQYMINENLILSTFNILRHPRELELALIRGRFNSKILAGMMSQRFPYSNRESAKFKLLRNPTPTPLAADIIWSFVLLPLYGLIGGLRGAASIDYSRIVDETSTLIRGDRKVAKNTAEKIVNDALKFLDDIEWIEYKNVKGPVKIFPDKSKGKGAVRDLFCEKWYETKVAESQKESKPAEEEKYEQLFFDSPDNK